MIKLYQKDSELHMNIVDIIIKKKNKESLTEEEIKYVIITNIPTTFSETFP